MAGILAQVIPRAEDNNQRNISTADNSRVLVIILKIVQAGAACRVPQSPISKYCGWVVQDELLRIDVFQEPRERFALQVLLKS